MARSFRCAPRPSRARSSSSSRQVSIREDASFHEVEPLPEACYGTEAEVDLMEVEKLKLERRCARERNHEANAQSALNSASRLRSELLGQESPRRIVPGGPPRHRSGSRKRSLQASAQRAGIAGLEAYLAEPDVPSPLHYLSREHPPTRVSRDDESEGSRTPGGLRSLPERQEEEREPGKGSAAASSSSSKPVGGGPQKQDQPTLSTLSSFDDDHLNLSEAGSGGTPHLAGHRLSSPAEIDEDAEEHFDSGLTEFQMAQSEPMGPRASENRMQPTRTIQSDPGASRRLRSKLWLPNGFGWPGKRQRTRLQRIGSGSLEPEEQDDQGDTGDQASIDENSTPGRSRQSSCLGFSRSSSREQDDNFFGVASIDHSDADGQQESAAVEGSFGIGAAGSVTPRRGSGRTSVSRISSTISSLVDACPKLPGRLRFSSSP
eukprot:TRINITY_DN24738_c0_g1_i1.p1 TRINITY_DN24738_c0_g1~~TRINITY_DN24738_c0_g1_i1.p1  ORF type:complete len:433 (-),score=39.08 TRINITY_DN24738_c0_g1_i1:277-1575(-)